MQNWSPPKDDSSREPHWAQTDCVTFDSRVWPSFMRLPLKHRKDSAALRQSHVGPKPCERSRGVQFRDNAAAADGRASLLSLSEDRCAPRPRRTKEECC